MRRIYQKFLGICLLGISAYLLCRLAMGNFPAGVNIAPLFAAAPLGALLTFSKIDFFED